MTFLKKFRATRLGGDRNLHKSPSDTFKVDQLLPQGTLEMAAVTVIVLLAAILRLNDITAQSLSLDEAYTRLVASFSYQTIFMVPFDVHPPLF